MKTTKEYNKMVEEVISKITFQYELEWSASFVPNGQVIAPDVPDDRRKITSVQFSIAWDEKLRDNIINEIIKTENDYVSFQELERNIIHYLGKNVEDRGIYYYTAKIAVVEK